MEHIKFRPARAFYLWPPLDAIKIISMQWDARPRISVQLPADSKKHPTPKIGANFERLVASSLNNLIRERETERERLRLVWLNV